MSTSTTSTSPFPFPPSNNHEVSLATTVSSLPLPSCIFNSPCPWATTLEDLDAIASSPYAGAVTTRTCLLHPFPHDDAIHKVAFHSASPSSINSLGYSPHDLPRYLEWLEQIAPRHPAKPIFISVTGTPTEIDQCLALISARKASMISRGLLMSGIAVEVNLSCPNIPNKPPPSYDMPSLRSYISSIAKHTTAAATSSPSPPTHPPLIVGLKTAAYLYETQFDDFVSVLKEFVPSPGSPDRHPISFLTAINTVGHSLVVDLDSESSVLRPSTFGGLGGASIHPIALGNVRKLYLLTRQPGLDGIDIIGCGGCDSGEAAFAFLLCGARAVVGATALGVGGGPGVYEGIWRGLKDIMEKKGYKSVEEFRGKLKD